VGFPLEPLSTDDLRTTFAQRLSAVTGSARSGVWRYRELVLPLPEQSIVSRAEGATPLHNVGAAQVSGGWRRIGEYAGLDWLTLKHEGENPTGSFKDRGMTVGMSVARSLGVRAVACASTGNTSASLAAYAAQAGLPALVFLPAGKVASGKLAQSIAYGARRVEVAGDFDEAMRQVEAVADDLGIYLLNSINPYRLAGQRSIGYELLQQLDWQAPDWIALPAGNLGNTSAIGAALIHARQLGLISRTPRIAAIQAAGAAPFYQSYAARWRELVPVRAQTRATAINIGAPVSYVRARAVIEATRGVVAQVSDEEIFAAKAQIDRAGIGCEPASAASLAGVRRLRAEGVIAPDARVLAILTGHLLKDTAQATTEDEEADADVETLTRQVRAALQRLSA
jgi:threonine synthase